MGRGLRGAVAVAVAGASLLVPLAAGVATAPPAAAAPPANTPARTGVPGNIYAIGDSITTATGTHQLGQENPVNSWITGEHPSPEGPRDNSPDVLSMRHRLGIPLNQAHMLASNGRRMQDFDNQANELPSSAQYVVVELGGNDLCRPSVAEMTTESSYRAEFRKGLQAVAANAPNALIFVASIPDVYNLWYLRGHRDDQTSQSEKARFFWDNPTGFVIPCESLLANPGNTGGADETRRRQVRARNLAFNQILADECAAVLRCRFDAFGLFARSSNRVDPFSNTSGGYLPRNQWWFEDRDISHDQGFWRDLCPANFTYDGCGDHFHPSHWGQAKLALAGHELSYQFQSDSTAPTRSTSVSRPPDGNGVYASAVDVSFGGTDANGIRGQETRVVPDGQAPGPWQQYIGLAPPVTISAVGTTHVQVRSLDNNGNLSTSTTRTVTIDPSQFGAVTGTVTGPSGPLAGIEVSLHAATTEGVLDTATTGPAGTYSFGALLATDDVKVVAHDPTGDHVDEWFDGAADHATATSVDVPGSGSATADIDLALTPGTVAGTVTGPDDAPLEGIEVELHAAGAEGVVESTTTDGQGGYAFETVPGTYRIVFVDPLNVYVGEWHQDAAGHGAATDVVVTKEQTTTVDATLALTPGSIEGTVTGPDGPVEGLSVTAVPAGPEAAGEPVLTGPDGSYEITDLLPGNYTVTVAAVACAWLGTGGAALVPPAGGSDTVDLEVEEELPGPHGLTGVGAWIEEAVKWLVDDCNDPQYMTGIDGDFATNQSITRGQALRALYRIQGQPEQGDAVDHGFSDVPGWVEQAVDWAADNGLMTGYPDGTFRVDDHISRAQMARLLFRIAGEPDNGGAGWPPHGLTDVDPWIETAVRWLVAEGHASGVNGSFQQNAPISRGQFANMAHSVFRA